MVGETHVCDPPEVTDDLTIAVNDLFLEVHADLTSSLGVILNPPLVKES